MNDEQYDTLKYIRENIINRKEFYIGKELSVLLKDLKMKPITFLPLWNFDRRNSLSTHLNLYFYTVDRIEELKQQHKNPAIVNIEWRTPLYTDKEVTEFAIKNKKQWDKTAEEFFRKSVIKDIKLVEYNYLQE